MLFNALEKATNRIIRWQHIHNNRTGLFAIVGDMCRKQVYSICTSSVYTAFKLIK